MPVRTSSTVWILETDHTGYAFGFDESGLLVHTYWGARLPRVEDYPAPPAAREWASFNGVGTLAREEFPAYASAKYIEPCFKASFANGVRDTVWAFERAEVTQGSGPELTVYLRDANYPLQAALHYRLHERCDLIERWVEISNPGEAAITLERIFSAMWNPPAGESYTLTHLAGKWLDEFHLHREELQPGVKVLDSRRITTSHNHSPWFLLERAAEPASETAGEAWFGALAWSGNWRLNAEVTAFNATRIGLGLNDWDFAWRLNPGESFTTPSSLAGYTREGRGGASRRLHDYIRDEIIPHGKTLHKVIYNSWEATTFHVSEASQIELAELAAEMGIELFVMDDGWFHGRSDDHAGLGDWWPDERKFPNGLGGLIQRVNALGMQFGLWVEPEMVNPNSELYRAHPDWAIHFPGRTPTEARNQLILNFARRQVQDYVIAKLDTLLTENNIAFIKWDMNRNVSEPGWEGAPGDPREIWVRYVQGVYRVWGELRRRHPQVIFQSCSGGGGRADLAILRLADQIWVSDNTEPSARLNIQEGFSQLFPANVMEAWVTDTGADYLPLEYRLHVSMCGSLGIGGHLIHWGTENRALAAHWIAVYKELREIIQFGDQFRLRSPQQHPYSAVQYLAKDQSAGVLFAFCTHAAFPAPVPTLRLQGLDPLALYTVEGFESARSGAAWMEAGLSIPLQDFHSSVRKISRISS
jgi:alpha-galactosidase